MNLIIATDVDGTITNKQRRISPRVIVLLRKLQKYGATIILVSSHAFPAVSALGHYMGVDYIIAETGGVAGRPWHPIFVEEIDKREEILEIAKKLGFRPTQSDPFRLTDIALFPPEGEDPLKVIEVLKSRLSNFNVSIEYSGYAVHISKYGINKGNALRRLMEQEKMRAPVIAFGDGLNDISLFKAADLSVTSCESPDGLKKVATLTLPHDNLRTVIIVLKSIEILFKLKYKNIDILKKIREWFESVSCSRIGVGSSSK